MGKPNIVGPFDDSAEMRQRRMGLLLSEGSINRQALETIALIYSGLFFDCLCDNYNETMQVLRICKNLLTLKDCSETRKIFLAICVQYDAMFIPLPDPVWWIAGNNEMVASFVHAFLQHLAKLADTIPTADEL